MSLAFSRFSWMHVHALFALLALPALLGPFRATTGFDGSFTIKRAPRLEDSHLWLQCSHRLGFVSHGPFDEADGQKLRLPLAPPGVVEGTMLDKDGAPLPGARIWIRNRRGRYENPLPGNRFERVTDQHGRFRFAAVPKGTFSLQAMKVGREFIATTPRFDVGVGETKVVHLREGKMQAPR